MTVTASTLLSLPLITTGTESGAWGNYVNNGLTSYLDNAIAGTVTLTNDGAVTLSNTAGTDTVTNIVSSLTGAGTVSAQFAAIRVTGTLTTAKVLTAPSSSRQYVVTNAATGSTVTIKASGQSGVSVAVGETATVYFNGTDYAKSATTLSGTGTVTSVAASVPAFLSIAGSPITTSGTLAITYSGTALPVANGGTGLTSGTSGGVLYYSATGTLASSAALTANTLLIGGGAGAAPTTTTTATGALTFLGTPSSANLAALLTDETGTGANVFATAPSITNPTVTNYVETPYSANSSTAITLDLANGTVQIITLTATTTITMPTAVSGKSFIMFLRQDATGSRTVTWTTVYWPAGTAPTITATASKQDVYSFFSDGSKWYGTTVGQNYTY